MKKIIYLFIPFFLITTLFAMEKTKEEKVAKFVLENIQKDYTTCYSFYKIAEEIFKSNNSNKSILNGIEKSADFTLKFAHDLGEVLELKPEIMTKNNEKEIKRLSKIAEKDFNELTQQYGLICKKLVEDQKQRINYWENEGNKKIK